MNTKPYLLIDVGNTRLKWAEAGPRGTIRALGQVETTRVTEAWSRSLAKKYRGRLVMIASVVPKASRLLKQGFPEAVFVSGAMDRLPLAFAYPKPAELGADRLAAALGARSRGAAIIVSCGTATAFSVLDRHGRFCGGAIAPGMMTQLDALLGATAQLPATTLKTNPRALGKSTRAAIVAGVVVGHQGAVKEIILRLRQELGVPARVLVTGGDADYLRGLRGLGRMEFRPLLVFEGLRMMAVASSP